MTDEGDDVQIQSNSLKQAARRPASLAGLLASRKSKAFTKGAKSEARNVET
jgi:hypothetical protein